MNKINALIIDNEKASRKKIRKYIEEKFPIIHITDEAHSVESGIKSIAVHNPDLLFMDLHLPDGIGFDILTKWESRNFEVIFITANEHYGIDAIKHHVLDYILKPINQKEFDLAIEKYLEKNAKSKTVDQMFGNFLNKRQHLQIALPTITGFKVVNAKEIVRLESDGGYTKIYFNDGRMILTSKYLKEYEKVLSRENFCRIHHSHIINVSCMKEYIKGRGGQVILLDGSTLNVSQNRKNQLLQFWA